MCILITPPLPHPSLLPPVKEQPHNWQTDSIPSSSYRIMDCKYFLLGNLLRKYQVLMVFEILVLITMLPLLLLSSIVFQPSMELICSPPSLLPLAIILGVTFTRPLQVKYFSNSLISSLTLPPPTPQHCFLPAPYNLSCLFNLFRQK